MSVDRRSLLAGFAVGAGGLLIGCDSPLPVPNRAPTADRTRIVPGTPRLASDKAPNSYTRLRPWVFTYRDGGVANPPGGVDLLGNLSELASLQAVQNRGSRIPNMEILTVFVGPDISDEEQALAQLSPFQEFINEKRRLRIQVRTNLVMTRYAIQSAYRGASSSEKPEERYHLLSKGLLADVITGFRPTSSPVSFIRDGINGLTVGEINIVNTLSTIWVQGADKNVLKRVVAADRK